MSDMNGVSYGTGHRNESGDWLKVGGGLLGGYLFGRWQDDRRGRNGEQGFNGAPCNTPYNAPYNGGCGENTVVNRYELNQEKEIASKSATIAKLEAEKYSDQVGIQVYERVMATINRDNDRRDCTINDLVKTSVETKVELRGLGDDVKYMGETTAREFKSIESQVNREFKHFRQMSNRLYVSQPSVKISSDDYEIETA